MPATIASTTMEDFRDRAHDLRNLFGAIVSARHMLDDGPDEARKILLLDAIEEAAHRGGELTTKLLAASPGAIAERLDLAARLRLLEPLLRSIAGSRNILDLDTGDAPAMARSAAERFDRVMLELVANARNALVCPGTIRIRLRARRDVIRLLVSDTGCGMSAQARRSLLTETPAAGANGTGFQQLRRFVHDSHGKLRMRSAPQRGTVIAIDLPAILTR